MPEGRPSIPRLFGRYVERLRWENAYSDAMQWRDWQTCEQLLEDQPAPLPWLIEKFVYLASRRWIYG